ncbi:MAG TPA: DUF547 domain-containing protein [Thermoanaerobaculia bacterium]|jgi:hypothetical protein
MKKALLPLFVLFGLHPLVVAGDRPDPAVFDAILAERARFGGFDYRAVTGQDRKRLAAYLANLGDADPKTTGEDGRKAFFINAYNAMAISIVLDHYPVKSIREIGGAFHSIRRKIGGELLTLDDIENRLRQANDARIHFAIVCASRSCPPLAGAAYRAAGLSAALDAQGRAFLNDASKNVVDRAHGRLALSQIFHWNRKEFERDGGSLLRYVSKFVTDPATASWMAGFRKEPEFLEYDWALNQSQ